MPISSGTSRGLGNWLAEGEDNRFVVLHIVYCTYCSRSFRCLTTEAGRLSRTSSETSRSVGWSLRGVSDREEDCDEDPQFSRSAVSMPVSIEVMAGELPDICSQSKKKKIRATRPWPLRRPFVHCLPVFPSNIL